MKRAKVGLLLLLGGLLSGCGNLFEGGVTFGGPTVLVSRENFSFSTETDQNNNTVYTYSYTLTLYALPGSGAGSVVLLDSSDNAVDAPFIIPEACPPSSPNPCGPYSRDYQKRASTPLSPVQVVKYRIISANGQSKVVPLPAPIEIY
ncbi:hypothetical protein CSW14_00795 [Thermus scotoductus]|jgi:hypothetical protein|uniref:Lipoprotein n=1 Tax=Thermus scotoductus TaxID=37636 RepID=A0A430VV49_THESC|nr:hypothetical protein CSW14_00795 [Thermus scotoductus]